jgi:hypothetical protein
MRKALHLVVIASVLALLPAASAAPASTPHVSVVRLSPFTLRGSGFAAGEHVAVRVRARAGAMRSIEATAAGTFVMRIAAVKIGNCGWYAVRAMGSLGTSAVTSVPPCSRTSILPDEPPPGYPYSSS